VVVVSRRWVFGTAVAVGLLLVVRSVRAQDPAQADGPLLNTPNQAPDAAPAASANPKARAASAPRTAAAQVAAPKQTAPRTWNGFAAESARTATRLPPAEREARAFLRAAAMDARLEAEASRLAQARSQAPGVLAFSDNLLDYRETADPELQHLLHARGMALPMMDNTQRKALNRLAKLKGPRFDRMYVELVGPEQQRVSVQEYEKALAAVADPVLKGWIERQLPLLRQQHDEAMRHFAGGEGRKGRSQAVRSASWPSGRTVSR
jgi:predicted outer membrane protein